MSRADNSNVALWRAISARATALAPTMQATEMASLVFAFSQMRFRDRDMMLRLAEATPAIQASFRAQDITYFLGAFARLDVKHRLVFNLFAREIARKLHDFTGAQLGELVYAYARLDMRHELLLEVLRKRILEVVKALKPLHLAMVASGFARLEVQDERFFTLIAAEICRKIHEFGGRPLAMVANAYARIGVRNRFLLEVLGDEVFRRRGQLQPQSVALALNAHARLQHANPVLFDYFAEDVPRHLKSYKLHSVCLVASAFARQRHAAPELFEKLGDFACRNAESLYPRAVASLVYSFASAECRHGVLFYNAPSHVLQNRAEYTTDELAMVAHAYGQFLMVHPPLFEAIAEQLPGRMLAPATASGPEAGDLEIPGFSAGEFREEPQIAGSLPRVASLVMILEAFGRVTIFDAEALGLLADALALRGGELELPLVVAATRALASLSFAHPGILELASRSLAESGDHLSEEAFGMLVRALQELGALGESPDRVALLERPDEAGRDA